MQPNTLIQLKALTSIQTWMISCLTIQLILEILRTIILIWRTDQQLATCGNVYVVATVFLAGTMPQMIGIAMRVSPMNTLTQPCLPRSRLRAVPGFSCLEALQSLPRSHLQVLLHDVDIERDDVDALAARILGTPMMGMMAVSGPSQKFQP